MITIKIVQAGDVGRIVATKKLGDGLWMHNDVGGSCTLPPGTYRVQVTKAWDDYETGRRCIGKLLDTKDIETARKTGMIDVSMYPEDVKEETRKRKASVAFDPSKVYFNATQIKVEEKLPVEKKPKAAPQKGYSLRGVKVFQGMDGVGLNATLLRDGKPICTLIDEGCGGEMLFRWHDVVRGEYRERDLFDAFIAAEKEKLDDTKKDEFGQIERDYFDAAMWVTNLVDKMENDKRFRRICKTKLVFQVGDQIGTDSFQTVKGLQFRAQIEKKYAGQKIRFLNDEV